MSEPREIHVVMADYMLYSDGSGRDFWQSKYGYTRWFYA